MADTNENIPQITKDTLIGELMEIDVGAAVILMSIGMHCIGCPASAGETIEEAAWVHGVEASELVDEINSYLAAKAELKEES